MIYEKPKIEIMAFWGEDIVTSSKFSDPWNSGDEDPLGGDI